MRSDPWDLAVPPDVFEEQIAYVQRYRSAMSMDDLVQRLRNGTVPADAIAITFDDGYRDNLIHAKPILERYDVPATLFLATGYTNSTVQFWWDELAGMVLESTEPTHEPFVLDGDPVNLDWELPEAADLHLRWRAWETPLTARHDAYVKAWRRLQSATEAQRISVMHHLRTRLKFTLDPLALPMSTDEVRTLLSGGVITLGAHTVTHPSLPNLGRMESQKEICESRDRCCELMASPVEGFAYPYGNFNSEVRDDVAVVGLSWACTTEGAFLDGRLLDFYALPRLGISNAHIGAFIKRITD